MSRRNMTTVASVLIVAVAVVAPWMRASVTAQTPAGRADAGEAAVTALVAEVRALRNEMAAAARNQLRAQLLLGRVQMQEQRLAYLDKQRSDTAAYAAVQSQLTSGLRSQVQSVERGGCAAVPTPDQRRDCEANTAMFRRQLADQEQREQQLRVQENELATALSAEQARWSDFNSRLDELERAIR